ncbi:hypothetical protein HA466_0217700 [Hirschfeldia incana]|nr:hypothetical protein HA466_0217700 [Hirschfeldia incana]
MSSELERKLKEVETHENLSLKYRLSSRIKRKGKRSVEEPQLEAGGSRGERKEHSGEEDDRSFTLWVFFTT